MTDQLARKKALNPTESFIVQAPAGSGKTELLTQRYLNLLAHAGTAPEEIIAITFTRKAASEMRERVVTAIHFALNNPEPELAHKKTTWGLAKKVIERDEQKQWHIIENPNRLRILTIDSLATMISSQVPLLSGFGAKPAISEDAGEFYQLAVDKLFTSSEKNPTLYTAIKSLLLHLENNAESLQNLLVQLLGKREQWLSHLMGIDSREILEQALNTIVEETIEHASAIVDSVEALKKIPVETADLEKLANLLLTSTGEFRKTVDKRCGFPSAASGKTAEEKALLKNNKEQMLFVLNAIADNTELKDALNNVLNCPPATYTDSQWQVIEALTIVLPILAAELNVIFHQYAAIDFTELTLGALRALNHNDNPTDLALYLDYQIQHILVDEFQDTSVMQFELLLELTKGWEPGDGRTLFLVGDPMQSVYRFRNAEVGLFLQAQHHGLGNVALTPLTLSLNFRSEPDIIKWVNSTFSIAFPLQADITAGAVPYTPACHPTKNESATNNTELLLTETRAEEAKKIAEIIQTIKIKNSDESIAILVRSRNQLNDIIPALRDKKIAFDAVQIEPLASQAIIQDLLSLTQALLHLNHRIAWLSFLRSPLCGLALNDLYVLAKDPDKKTIWQNMIAAITDNQISEHARQTLERVTPIVNNILKMQGEQSLSQWLKGAWIALGGPATADDESNLKQADTFFNLIESIDHDFSLTALTNKLNGLFSDVENHEANSVSVMTIHKSKGLEFDHVILPGLARYSPADKSALLMWLERPTEHGELDLILAPIKAGADKEDAIHHYLRRLEKNKLNYESARLFYVATTRAKKALYLTSDLSFNSGGKPKINQHSFLGLCELAHKTAILSAAEKIERTDIDDNETRVIPDQTRLRLTNDFTHIATKTSFIATENTDLNRTEDLVSQTPRKLGQIIHQLLAEIGSGNEYNLETRAACLLKLFYLPEQDFKQHHGVILTAINNTLSDPVGKWILSSQQDSHFEYPITVSHKNKIKHYIIDRTFIFENKRWIIDFKTATPTESQTESDFIKEQYSLYKNQLENYARAFALMDTRPIQIGLYFPLCQLWYDASIRTQAPALWE